MSPGWRLERGLRPGIRVLPQHAPYGRSSVLIPRRSSIALVARRHLLKGQTEVEDVAGADLLVQHQLDQLRQKAAHRRGAAVQVDVSVEHLLVLERNAKRDADVPFRERDA